MKANGASVVGGLVALLLTVAFVGLVGSCAITIGIWPGQVKLVAPIFCTDAQPDPFVVSDTYHPAPGETTTDFSLYCMGPRGDATDHGFMKPFLLISVVNGVVLTGVAVLFVLLMRPYVNGRGRRHRGSGDDGSRNHSRTSRRGSATTVDTGTGTGTGPFVS